MFLGIDLGSSGVRISICNENEELVFFNEIKYPVGLEIPNNWSKCCQELIGKIPTSIKRDIKACSVDGTSGTLLACNKEGLPLGPALAFNENYYEHIDSINSLFPGLNDVIYKKNSLSRAFELIKNHGKDILLRHQADWINGWLMNNWNYGEEGNNLRLGWDIIHKKWPDSYQQLPWLNSLPTIIESGCKVGMISPSKAKNLDLSEQTIIISGTTDSNAAVIASKAKLSEGISVLGSTIVVKSFVSKPLNGDGISNHRIAGQWLAGGASNAGGKVLKEFFTDKELIELSRQINPHITTGIKMIPLPKKGERFPINDPNLKPLLEPRPISDSLFLHAMLEGLAEIEAKGWKKLIEMGANPPERIITIGGGANNPQWRIIREKAINIPIKTSNNPTSYGSAIIALKGFRKILK